MIAAATLSLTVGTTPQEATAQTGPAVSLSVAPNPVAEGQSVTVTATLASALSANVTVPLVLTAGTAEAGDFGSLASITISGGQTTGTGTITTVKDLDRDDERFTVALGTLPAAVSRGTPSSVDVNITDEPLAELVEDSARWADGGPSCLESHRPWVCRLRSRSTARVGKRRGLRQPASTVFSTSVEGHG